MWVHVLMELMLGPQLPAGSGTNSDLWRVTSWVLKGTYLPAQLEHLYHRNPHESHGQTGCPCQPGATGSPPNQDY